MQTNRNSNRKILGQILFAGILLVFIIIIFLKYTRESNERIVRQNEIYVEDATIQVAERIDGVLESAGKSIQTIAYVYGIALESPEVEPGALNDIAENSAFDYVEFVNKDGQNLTSDGKTADVSDREYYIEGMKGNTGIFVTKNSRITKETLVTFYAPLRYEGEIIGVLNGIYREVGMQQILSTAFFGTQAKCYLCMKDGTVISSTGDDAAPENILETLPDTLRTSQDTIEKIRQAFEKHESFGYRYEGSQGPGNAYITGLSQSDWMFMQTFPSKVTNYMIESANSAGVRLEAQLILAFGVYILLLLFLNWKERKQLVSEKQEMSWIVEGVMQLFARFIVVDLEKDTYEYLKDMEEGWAKKGRYSDLVEYFIPKYVREDGTENMQQVITKEYIQTKMDEDTPYLQFEYRIRREDERWENISILSLKRKKGVPVRILYAIQDVTALKEDELRNRAALIEAFQAADEANHAKSEFLSRMSHDIRTPMNAIMGMTTVASMYMDDRERLADCLEKITLSSRHLLALINDVLDMSKIESGNVTLAEEEFDLEKTVESLLAIIQPQVQEKQQHLEVNIAGIIHKAVIGDPLRLQQVFVNIMGNAVKFTPEGGTLTFGIVEKTSRIQGSGCYEFTFEDTGIGMEKEFLEKIFEPFSREENTRSRKIEGTGLGMSIAKNIVRMMNGDIQVESTPDVGSKFTVQIYLKLQEITEEAAETRQDFKSSSEAVEENVSELEKLGQKDYSGKRVLVVEDNDLNIEIAEELLEFMGIEVEKARDGQQAVDILLERPKDYYDLIFMDIQMPNKNGYEASKEIRASGREDLKTIPIVAMSADAFSDDIQRAVSAGMNDHVAKPIELPKLSAALEKWIK